MKTGIAEAAKAHCIWLLLMFLILTVGCDASLTIGNRTIGVNSGNFIFTDGSLTTNYRYPFDEVWKACEQTLADMKAIAVQKNLKIASGSMNAVVQEEKLQILVEYVSKSQTSVSVRVGMSGNNMASQLIHEKIANNILKSHRTDEP
ncbi:MAG: DUF3568 family protein [Syntrophales bacterium]|jgi:hypothetical protein